MAAGVVVLASSALAAAPPSSAPSDSTVEVPGDLDHIDQLIAGLLSADLLGVPAEWAIRDADSGIVDATVLDDLDPFLGLLTCPDGTILAVADRTWAARRYSGAEVPLENGLLSVDIIVEEESGADAAADHAALADCTVGDQAQLTVGSTELDRAEHGPTAATTIELLASPSATVAYPSAFNGTIVNVDGRTVTVILGGIDMGESWQSLADDIAVIALDHLSGAQPPPTSPPTT